MSTADALQSAFVDRAVAYFALTWIVIAIAVGLWGSELKRRRFWTWFALSLLTGPVAWYLLLFRVGIAVPASVRAECPACGRATRRDMPRCIHCRTLIDRAARDRAGEMGRQAAAAVFTARRLFATARRAADQARAQGVRRGRSESRPDV